MLEMSCIRCYYTLVCNYHDQERNRKAIEGLGFEKKSGGCHDIWVKPGFPPTPVPRHKGDIPSGTARSILKSSGLEGGKR